MNEMWTCPKGCHNQEYFHVTQDEHREDTITHRYEGDDRTLSKEVGEPKVYVGEESTHGPATCGICEGPVLWGIGQKENSYQVVYKHADGVQHRSSTIKVTAQVDAFKEHMAVFTAFGMFKSHGVITEFVGIERINKE